MSKQTIIDKINEIDGAIKTNTSSINELGGRVADNTTTINALKWNYVEETVYSANQGRWDWAESKTIYDIKMLIPGSSDAEYAVQGVWDTAGYIHFSFTARWGLPGAGKGDWLRGILELKNGGFYTITGIGADGSIHSPSGEWTLKIWYRKLLTV
jgi:hypothetical protein